MGDSAHANVIVRPLAESDLADADRVIRLAFGTFHGMSDPLKFLGDRDYARTRWGADPAAAVAAEDNGLLIGSNFATNWGSFGFFGPLTVDPAYWNRGVAQQLLAPTMGMFRHWGNRHLGLYTYAQSTKHVALYQKFGFWPRDLVAITAKELAPASARPEAVADTGRFSEAMSGDKPSLLAACREVSEANFEGLDVQREICAVSEQALGDTVLAWDRAKLAAFAVCHTGPGTEAGSGVCYVKFAAARPGPRAEANFRRLLGAVEAFARSRQAGKITAGVNLARREVVREMTAGGFRAEVQGVAMESGGPSSGYNRAGVYIVDDWR